MHKPTEKRTTVKFFDSISSDEDELTGKLEHTETSKNFPLVSLSTPEHGGAQIDRKEPEVEAKLGANASNWHMDCHDPIVLPLRLPVNEAVRAAAGAPTVVSVNNDFQSSNPEHMEKVEYKNQDPVAKSAVNILPNVAQSPTSSTFETTTEGSVFKAEEVAPEAPNTASLMMPPLRSSIQEAPTLHEKLEPNRITLLDMQDRGATTLRDSKTIQKFSDPGHMPSWTSFVPVANELRPEDTGSRMCDSHQRKCDSDDRACLDIQNPTSFGDYLFPRLDKSLADDSQPFTYEAPPPNCVEKGIAMLLRVDARVFIYYLSLLPTVPLKIASILTSQIDSVDHSCYTYWGYKKACWQVAYTVPTALLQNSRIKHSLNAAAVLSIFAVVFYLFSFISVTVYIYCIKNPCEKLGKFRRWAIASWGLLAFLMHCVAWIVILALFNAHFTKTKSHTWYLGVGFDLSLISCFLHSLGLAVLLILPPFKITCE